MFLIFGHDTLIAPFRKKRKREIEFKNITAAWLTFCHGLKDYNLQD